MGHLPPSKPTRLIMHVLLVLPVTPVATMMRTGMAVAEWQVGRAGEGGGHGSNDARREVREESGRRLGARDLGRGETHPQGGANTQTSRR